MREHATNPAEAVNAFTRAVIFNLLIGNNDAHAKNFSLLHHIDGTTVLAPLYDLVSTEIYQQFRNGDMAMKFGGTYDFKWVNRQYVEKMAHDIGVNPSGLRHILLDMASKSGQLAKECAHELGYPIGFVIADVVQKRAESLIARLVQS